MQKLELELPIVTPKLPKIAYYMTTQEKFQFLNTLNIEPGDDRVLVLPDESETKTAGGIIIPDVSREKPRKGVIYNVGPCGEGINPLNLTSGDYVVYGKYAGTEIQVDKIELNLMRVHDIHFRYGKGLKEIPNFRLQQ